MSENFGKTVLVVVLVLCLARLLSAAVFTPERSTAITYHGPAYELDESEVAYARSKGCAP